MAGRSSSMAFVPADWDLSGRMDTMSDGVIGVAKRPMNHKSLMVMLLWPFASADFEMSFIAMYHAMM